jgi:DeoR family glycerol-3-phosphate regulon repressor
MHKTARQATILKTLTLQGTCRVTGLAAQLGVSDETIRRDIQAMANRGLVERVHGAVVLPDLFREPDFRRRLDHNAEAKRAIARSAARHVRDGESVMLDTGSTTVYVARALAQHRDLMVVTNCAEIARGLASRNRNRVYLAGGEFRAEDSAVFGAAALRFVEQFRVRTAILSIAAIDAQDGLMDFHLAEADFSRAVIRRAERVIVVADGSKFTAQAPIKVCDLTDIDLLVTDRPPPPAAVARLAEAEVGVVVAHPERAPSAQKRKAP